MATDGSADRPHEEAPTIVARSPVQQAGGSGNGGGGGDLTEELLTSDWWTDAMVAAAGIPLVDVPFVTVGGGMGSFVTTDYLRVAGVPIDRMRVLSDIDFPWQTYEYLTRVSQIPRPERIRSDSASRPDNLWGFPSYAAGGSGPQQDPGATVAGPGRADLGGLLHPARGPGVRRTGARVEADQLLGHAGQGPGPDGTPPPGRRLLHDPHPSRRQAGAPCRVPVPVRPPRGRVSGPEVPARAAGLPRPRTRTSTTWSAPTRITSTSTTGSA